MCDLNLIICRLGSFFTHLDLRAIVSLPTEKEKMFFKHYGSTLFISDFKAGRAALVTIVKKICVINLHLV